MSKKDVQTLVTRNAMKNRLDQKLAATCAILGSSNQSADRRHRAVVTVWNGGVARTQKHLLKVKPRRGVRKYQSKTMTPQAVSAVAFKEPETSGASRLTVFWGLQRQISRKGCHGIEFKFFPGAAAARCAAVVARARWRYLLTAFGV